MVPQASSSLSGWLAKSQSGHFRIRDTRMGSAIAPIREISRAFGLGDGAADDGNLQAR